MARRNKSEFQREVELAREAGKRQIASLRGQIEKYTEEIAFGAYEDTFVSRQERIAKREKAIDNFEKLVNQTYVKSNSAEVRKFAADQLRMQSLAEQKRLNKQAEYEISHTFMVEADTKEHIQNPASSYTEAEMRTFFRATQSAWQGKEYTNRYQAIMEYYDVTDLRAFIEAVLKVNPDAISRYETIQQEAGKAKDAEDISGEDEKEHSTSPKTMSVSISPELYTAYEEARQAKYGLQIPDSLSY